VPVHLVRNLDKQFPYPRFVPWQRTGKWIFKKTVERDVGTAHEVHTAVEICSFGSGIEAEFPHAETSCGAVASSIGFKDIKTWRFRRPQMRRCNRQCLENHFAFARRKRETLWCRSRDRSAVFPGVHSLREVKGHGGVGEVVQGCLH